MDPLQRTASLVGVDIQRLLKKYSKEKNSTGSAEGEKYEVSQTKQRKNNSDHSSQKLDCLIICNYCNGIGISNVFYNHQVRVANCQHCDGEGLLCKSPNGTLEKLYDMHMSGN